MECQAEQERTGFLVLFDLIGQLARKRFQTAEQHLVRLGFNHTQARLLSLLSHHDGVATQETLSSSMFVDRSNAGRALKQLEQRGYLTRKPDPHDHRTKSVQLTGKGRKAVLEIAREKKAIAEQMFAGLREEEAYFIATLLKNAL